MKRSSGLLLLTLSATFFTAASCSKAPDIITGEVEVAEVDIGVKIPGRISKLEVHEGAAVKKDDILGYLESKELEAKLQTVKAAVSEAEKQFEFAKNTFDRIQKLHTDGVVTRQQFDETKYKFEAARQKVEATTGQLNEVKAAYGEMLIKAPIDGEVVQIISRAGEIVSPGFPIVTLIDLNDQWVTFQVREDRLTKLSKGLPVQVRFPALGGQAHTFKISYISALGAFAKWKATNEAGTFDLKTFEVRARPDQPLPQLRPGMTALVELAK